MAAESNLHALFSLTVFLLSDVSFLLEKDNADVNWSWHFPESRMSLARLPQMVVVNWWHKRAYFQSEKITFGVN